MNFFLDFGIFLIFVLDCIGRTKYILSARALCNTGDVSMLMSPNILDKQIEELG